MRQLCLSTLITGFLLTHISEGFSQQLKLGKNPSSSLLKSAVLELQSDNQGLLLTRLADTVSINLFSPPDGMLIYLTSVKQAYIRANGGWRAIASGVIDTTNIANFYLKVRSRLSAGSGISYNTTTGVVTNSGVLSLNGNTGALTMDTGYIANFYQKVRGLFSAATPITLATNGQIGITQASATTNGYLSSTDWTTFNNKLSANNVWTRSGNAGTNSTTDFIGTTDAQDLVFKTDNTERWRIQNTSGDIKIGSATSGTFKATKELVMRQDGDEYGSSILRLRNRTAENGAIFETTDPTVTLVDFIFKTAVSQRNIRYEGRSSYSLVGIPAFHIGGSNPDVPNLAIGDVYSAFNTKLKIGNYTTATEMLDVAGNVKFSGALMPNNTAGTSGQFLKSNGANTAPTWVSPSLSDLSNVSLSSPANGQVLQYNGTNWTNASGSSGDNITLLTADDATTSTNLANVDGLSFSVTSGKTYKFKFFIFYLSSATSRGSQWTINGPSFSLLSYYSSYSLTTSSITINQGLSSYDNPASNTNNGTSAATTGNTAIIEGIIKASANGTVIARFAAESGGTITAKAGSYVEYKQLD